MSQADFWVVVAAILTATIGWVNRHRLPRLLKLRLGPLELPATDGFTVLVADLDKDPDCARTNHLVQALGRMGGFHVRTAGEVLKCAPVGGTLAREQTRLRDKAQALLRDHGADVLIWGIHLDQTYQLGFVPREGDAASGGGLTGFDIKPDFTLPDELSEAMRNLLNLTILTNIRPAAKESGTYLVGRLRPLVPKLEAYLKGAKDLPLGQLATAWHSLGLAHYTIGAQAGDNGALEQAIDAYGKALALTYRETQPNTWAMIQGNLAVALLALGERENSTTRLEEAAGVYREILGVFTQEAAPLDWAKAQNNLGNALARLGERESGTEGIERLEEAVRAYREALKEYTRKRVPLNWAGTQNNLGAALQTLGKRESGTKGIERLEEAVRAYGEALKEYTRKRVPLDWAMTQNNLGNALLSLGQRESGTKRLKEAVQAFREALKEHTRERVPLDWAMTQNNLGVALWCFAEKAKDPAKAREALKHYQAAHEVYTQAAPYYQEMVEGNIRKLQAFIEKLEKGR